MRIILSVRKSFYPRADKFTETAIDVTIYCCLLLHLKEARLSNHLQEDLISSGSLIQRFIHNIKKALLLWTIVNMAFIFHEFLDILLTKVGISTTYDIRRDISSSGL